jgi:hypothetical protein
MPHFSVAWPVTPPNVAVVGMGADPQQTPE